jgi:DNA polymerase
MMDDDFSYGFIAFRVRGAEPELLFLKRREGFLDVPKGHPENSENAMDAALREMREETGLEPKEILKGFRMEAYYSMGRDSGKRTKHIMLFLCRVSGEPSLSDEHSGFEWLSEERMRKSGESFIGNAKEELMEAFEYIRRNDAIERLNKEYSKLPYSTDGWKLSSNFVPGTGNLLAGVMLVGQAPGAEEDKSGVPFVGRSGKLLDRLISIAGLKREDLYITSVVQFFPPKNRLPSREETALCLPYLRRQIEIVRPRIIVTLGALSSYSLVGVEKIALNHGIPVIQDGVTYFPSLHPAAGVRFKKNVALLEKDFEELGKLIS